jgi:hypothetical protein
MSAYYYAAESERPLKRRRVSRKYSRRTHTVSRRAARPRSYAKSVWKKPAFWRSRFYRKKIGGRHRRPIRSRYPSPTPYETGIKSHKDFRESSLVVDGLNPLTRSSAGTAHNVNHAMVIAPIQSGSSDRTIQGSKAHYLGANIDLRMKSRTTNINSVVRFTVVELKTQSAAPGGTIDLTTSLLNDYYKNENAALNDETYIHFADASMAQREYFSINESKFRVLKQTYVSLGNTGLAGTAGHGPATKSSSSGRFRCFIPMRRILDDDGWAVWKQPDSAGTALDSVNRQSYEKPIVLLIEYFFPPGTNAGINSILVSYDMVTKHSFRDGI